MIIDPIKIDDLSENFEDAFIVFEERLRAVLMAERDEDRRAYRDGDGYYKGSYSPERYYVSSILAFLEDNTAARSLYDRIARFNGFTRYDYAVD
jgi:hypothetical protein